jgi:TonB-linked SusC/RagA family outer membrane protein
MTLKLFSERFRDNFFLISMFFIFIVSAQAQKKVSGTVTSNGVPLPSANVVVKGTTNGASTDIDGKFILNVSDDAKTLVVSYLGFATKEVAITSGEMKISLVEEKNTLEEVVINVGYGTQKKSVVTGAISKVSAKDLEKVPNGRIEQALQGRVSGVSIAANSGQPGTASTVRVRGITTFGGGNDPLWVIDGVLANAGGIGALNQSDIESIEVLKDATSAAIYGTQAARGVIMVTTKKGKKGKINVNYNVFTGVSSPAKTLKLLNAMEYGALMNEKSVASGGNVLYNNLSTLGVGTDWQKAIFNTGAQRYSHELSFSGGNDVSTFYMSFGMQDQEGIVSTDISNYNKKNIRLNSTHKISKIFTVGQTIGYSRQKSVGIGNTNSEYGGPLSSAINLDPITPLVETDPTIVNNPLGIYANNPVIRDEFGNPYGISSIVGQEMTNPLAYAKTRLGNYGWSDDFVGNVFVEVSPANHFKFKSTLGAKLAYYGSQSFTPKYYLNATTLTNQNNYSKTSNDVFDYNIENTLTYSNKIKDHDFTLLLGQGAYFTENGGGSGVTYFGLPVNDYHDASFNFVIPASQISAYSFDFVHHKLTSLFARLNYNFKEKYLLTAIMRRDGSTRFGMNHKYGNFPSFSLGWVVSKEDFWKDNKYVNTLKLRGGYGVVGNDAIDNFRYAATIVGGYNYNLGGNIATGYAPNSIENPDLRWEKTSQLNLGFDTKLLNDFNLSVEYYNKNTTGILRPVQVPGYVGVTSNPAGNIASMENKGLEFELAYRKKIGQVNFSASGNFSTLKNEVTSVDQNSNFIPGEASFQSMGAVTRTQVGESYNSFYGFQTNGIFQNWDEVNAYKNSAGGLIQPNAQPGDFRWVDVNGDGIVDINKDDDKTFLGSSIPKCTFGLTLNADYKGFDIMVFTTGAAGHKIFQGLRRLDILNANYQTEALGRWHGEGTSDSYPRLTNNDTNGNFSRMSDFYLEKGDYVRLKVVQLGYSLKEGMISKIGASKVRLYVTGENLFTFTKYTGYDPEIGGGVYGIDKGFYPQARTFMFGANLQF